MVCPGNRCHHYYNHQATHKSSSSSPPLQNSYGISIITIIETLVCHHMYDQKQSHASCSVHFPTAVRQYAQIFITSLTCITLVMFCNQASNILEEEEFSRNLSMCKNLFVIFSRAIAMQKRGQGGLAEPFEVAPIQNCVTSKQSSEKQVLRTAHTVLCEEIQISIIHVHCHLRSTFPYGPIQKLYCLYGIIQTQNQKLIVRLSKTKVEYEIFKIKILLGDCQNQKLIMRLSKTKVDYEIVKIKS